MNGFLNKNLKSYAKNWLAPVKYAEMQSKNAVRNQYTNLYAYAANNPVHYIDPDGRENSLMDWLFDWFSSSSTPPSQKDVFNATANYYGQQVSGGAQIIQNKLSRPMEAALKVAGDTIIASAEFMSDYGGVIAVACYASGNVQLGVMIDTVVIACDISLIVYKYFNDKISLEEFVKEAGCIAVSNFTGYKIGSNFEKAASRIFIDPNFPKMLAGVVSNLVGQSVSVLEETQSN